MASSRTARQGRRLKRLVLAGLAVPLWVAACRLDDRVLSEGPSLPNGAIGCGMRGSTACETCLYRDCCEQAQVCREGSECVTYLTCFEGCAGVASCRSACAVSYPSGFGDAAALGLCAQSECVACSDQARFEACEPTGAGACESTNDCTALEQGVLQELDAANCPDCRDDVLGQACQRCLAVETGLSGPCTSCIAQSISCLTDYCLLACQPDADAGCDQCLSSAGCTSQLAACAFAG